MFTYLGIEIDCKNGVIRVPRKKREKFLADIQHIHSGPDTLDFHLLEKIRGRAVSFSHVIPQMRMYIRQMSTSLTEAEGNLESQITLTSDLKDELSTWLEQENFLHKERSFSDFSEIDIVMKNTIPDLEYMSDASDFAIGIYDCNTHQTLRRQFSVQEGTTINIAGKEALAVQMVLKNLPLHPPPRHVRLHVDNQGKIRFVYIYI